MFIGHTNRLALATKGTGPLATGVLLLGLLFPAVAAAQSAPAISAKAAVVMDYKTGAILYGKAPDEVRSPASLTKIMTAVVALERGDLMKRGGGSGKAASVSGATFGLKAGDRPPLWKLLYGMLLKSGNDAAIAISEGVAGSESAFVDLMNRKAKVLRLSHTHFANPHGLTAAGHYTTAREMAQLTRAALRNRGFAKVVSTKGRVLSWYGRDRLVVNINKILWRYQGAEGVKTGYTSAAGYCLATTAVSSKTGDRLIAVLMGCPSSEQRWRDAASLLNWGFAEAKNLKAGQPFTYRITKGDTLSEIAMRFKVPINRISAVNGLANNGLIRAGDKLLIPR
jgi:D-alanyl-D-alanine carboxypeptidase (penicillin-binding protein 5/6)